MKLILSKDSLSILRLKSELLMGSYLQVGIWYESNFLGYFHVHLCILETERLEMY